MTADVEPALVVEGLSKYYERRTPRWRRILLPWSRVDTGGDDLEDDDDIEDEIDDEEVDLPESGTWALRDVSFTVARGEIVALIGSTDSGKTLMRILDGISMPTAGRVEVHGRMGLTPATLKLLVPSGATARKTLRGVARAMGAPRDLVRRREAAVFELAGIPVERDRDFRKLTSDLKRRFLFASVMSLDPDVLLVEGRPFQTDEAYHQLWLDAILRARDERGAGVLLRVEQLRFVEHVADRVVWLDDGEVRAIGEPSEVIASYREALEQEAREHGTDVEGPLSSARLIGADGEETQEVAAGDDARIEADVEVSDLRTLVECALQLRGEHRDDAERTMWTRRLNVAGTYTIRCTVPAAWLAGGHWKGRLTIATTELHGQRRIAQQDVVFTVAGDDAATSDATLDEVADWTIGEQVAEPSPAG